MSNLTEVTKSPAKRAEWLMSSEGLAASLALPTSFADSLLRRMKRESWEVYPEEWKLDKDGRGTVVYKVQAGSFEFRKIIFSDELQEDEREDRSIADKWDGIGFLLEGEVDERRIDYFWQELNKSGRGWRVDQKTYCWSKVNRSGRLFDYVVDSLAKGEQPNVAKLDEVGYLFRNSGVIANGAQGTLPFDSYRADLHPDHPLGRPFHAQLLALYIWRCFSLDLVEYLASQRNPNLSTRLAAHQRNSVGVGNASALGLVVFAINHPLLLNRWKQNGEDRLTEVFAEVWSRLDLKRLSKVLQKLLIRENIPAKFHPNHRELVTVIGEGPIMGSELRHKALSLLPDELHELFFVAALKVKDSFDHESPDLVQNEVFALPYEVPVSTFIETLESNYEWALNSRGAPRKVSYYRSEVNREPRLAYSDLVPNSSDLNLSIAEQVRTLYHRLRQFPAESLMVDFMRTHKDLSFIVSRVYTCADLPYSELRIDLSDPHQKPTSVIRYCMALFGFESLTDGPDGISVRGVIFRDLEVDPLENISSRAKVQVTGLPGIPTRQVDRPTVFVSPHELSALLDKVTMNIFGDKMSADLFSEWLRELLVRVPQNGQRFQELFEEIASGTRRNNFLRLVDDILGALSDWFLSEAQLVARLFSYEDREFLSAALRVLGDQGQQAYLLDYSTGLPQFTNHIPGSIESAIKNNCGAVSRTCYDSREILESRCLSQEQLDQLHDGEAIALVLANRSVPNLEVVELSNSVIQNNGDQYCSSNWLPIDVTIWRFLFSVADRFLVPVSSGL